LIPIFKTLASIQEPFNMPRQMLPTSYQHNGCIDIVTVQTIQSGSMSGTNIKAFVMDAAETHDLDTIEQWTRQIKQTNSTDTIIAFATK
jgi:CMP-N-acetylneuraminic acid synthetase